MSWDDTIDRLYDEHGPTDDFDRALIAAMLDLLGTGPDHSREVQEAVARTWVGIMSPIQTTPAALWKQIFETVGPIAFHRPIPTVPSVVYRIALPDWAWGWSWSWSSDPCSGMRSDDIDLATAFDYQHWAMPKQCWYRTTVAPSAIRIAIPDGFPVKWRGVTRLSIDELVVDPSMLSHVERVSPKEMRETFFVEKTKPLNPLLVSE